MFPNLARSALAPTTAMREAPRKAWILDEAIVIVAVALDARVGVRAVVATMKMKPLVVAVAVASSSRSRRRRGRRRMRWQSRRPSFPPSSVGGVRKRSKRKDEGVCRLYRTGYDWGLGRQLSSDQDKQGSR